MLSLCSFLPTLFKEVTVRKETENYNDVKMILFKQITKNRYLRQRTKRMWHWKRFSGAKRHG